MTGDTIAFVLIAAAPFTCAALGYAYFRRFGRGRRRSGWPVLLCGNAVVLLGLLSVLILGLECHYRFVSDTTDGDAATKVSQRWFRRNWPTNNKNLRDDVDYWPKKAMPRRVTFFGDSFTAGHGVSLDERFVNKVRHARPDWEVHGIAWLGAQTVGEFRYLDRLIRSGYELDTVVLVYCFNDLEPFVEGMNAVYENYEGHPPAALALVVKHSYAFNQLFYYWTIWRASRTPGLDYFGKIEEAYRGPAWEKEKRILTGFRNTVTRAGGRLLVVTFPMLIRLGRGEDENHAMHEVIDPFWREQGVPHLDLLPVLSPHKGRRLVVSGHDDHPGPYAHSLATDAILRFIETADPLPRENYTGKKPNLPPETTSLKSIFMKSVATPQPELTIEDQKAQAEESIEFLNNIKETLDEDDWEGLTESIEARLDQLEEEEE